LARRYDLAGRLLFSSFNPLALVRIRQLLPGVSTALIAFGGLPGWLARSMLLELLGCAALHPVIGDVTPALVQGLHRRGKRVNPHTANRLEAMQHMVDLQVDGFFTDDPALARQVLSGNISS
jgi:glycerophosphoryl diester phosphodiesterase